MHAFNLSIQEAEAARSLNLGPARSTEFRDNQGYIEKSYLKTTTTTKKGPYVFSAKINHLVNVFIIAVGMDMANCPHPLTRGPMVFPSHCFLLPP